MCDNELIRISKENKDFLTLIKTKIQEKIKYKKITYDDVISYLTGENIKFMPENPLKQENFLFYGKPNEAMWEAKARISLQIFKYPARISHIKGDNNVKTK